MKNGTAITIVKSSNGFVIFEQENIDLPADASQMATFNKLAHSYDGSVVDFVENHFEPRDKPAPDND
jgi:hypothetical protein